MPDYRSVKYYHSNGSVEDLSFLTYSGENYKEAADKANSLMREDPGGRLVTDSETKSYLRNFGMSSGSW